MLKSDISLQDSDISLKDLRLIAEFFVAILYFIVFSLKKDAVPFSAKYTYIADF